MERLTASVEAGASRNPMPAPARAAYGHWSCMDRSVILCAQSAKPAAPSAAPSFIAGRAPRLSRMRPPHCEAMPKPMKKYSRNSAAWFGDALSETCAYTEAKKNTGTKASIEKKSTRLSTVNARSRKTRSLMSGCSTPSS